MRPQYRSASSYLAAIGRPQRVIMTNSKHLRSALNPDLFECSDAGKVGHAQQSLPSWMGGQGTVAYEQNTQQSPSSGFKTVLQLLHS